jgi:hypothetical protein
MENTTNSRNFQKKPCLHYNEIVILMDKLPLPYELVEIIYKKTKSMNDSYRWITKRKKRLTEYGLQELIFHSKCIGINYKFNVLNDDHLASKIELSHLLGRYVSGISKKAI